jgi:outer membrane protein assembly factor BamB
MKTLKNKTVTIALLLLLSISAVFIDLPAAAATTYNYQTFTYLSIRPNPCGVNQTLLINFWISPPMPQPGIIAHGYTVEITHPDGTKETLGPFNSIQADTSGYTEWTPKETGEYKLKVIYPGETVPPGTPYQSITVGSAFTSYTTDTYIFSAAESPVTTLNVTETQLPGYVPTPLPTEYWNRPVTIENREWSQVGMGNWEMQGADMRSSYSQLYGGAPGSAHIYWVLTSGVGGIVGDEYGDAIFGGNPPGDSNVARYMTRAVAGMGYYSATDGVHCVDLTTGKELWVRKDVSISIATVENYVVRAQGPPIDSYNAILMSVGTQLLKYSAYTGDLICNVTGMSGTFDPTPHYNAGITSPSGAGGNEVGMQQFVYSTSGSGANRRLIKWTTQGSSTNFTSRIAWNVSYPFSSVTAIDDDLGIGFYFSISPSSGGTCGAFDINTGNMLWTKTYGQTDAPFATSADVLENGVYVYPLYYGDPNQNGLRPLAGIDIKTGKMLYNTTITSYPWGSFWCYSHAAADGLAFFPTYTGYVYAFNVTTGQVAWKGGYNAVGYETPYGYQPFFSSIATGGGYVFAGNDEHSENPPYYQGKQMWCLNATTGETVWSIPFWSPGFNMQGLIADGKLIATNFYDNRQYCFYKGQTETSVTASPKVSDFGSSVLIEGSVYDKSPGTTDDRIVAKFPQGLPAVSEDSMSAFMAYTYMQMAKPTNTTGVPVTLTVVDVNGNCRTIGTPTSDADGAFRYTWHPDIEGQYVVYASFDGSTSYWPSHAVTAFTVDPAETAAPTAIPLTGLATTADLMTYMAVGVIAIIIAIAIVGVLLLRKRP